MLSRVRAGITARMLTGVGRIRRARPFRRPIGMPPARWNSAISDDELVRYLVAAAKAHSGQGAAGPMVLLGEPGDANLAAVRQELTANAIATSTRRLDEIADASEDPAAILCCYADAAAITAAARAVSDNPRWARAPFEFKGVRTKDPDAQLLQRHDPQWYGVDQFISPLLTEHPQLIAIYEDSLQRFELKCDVRDYFDLCQFLILVVRNDVPGDVAEFGSYQGHSGYLIARVLEALNSSKRVYLFDTFESFPTESHGVDRFWSGTHAVNFEKVAEKFADLESVTLVRGDFTETLPQSGIERLALAFVDCDSYRGIRYLATHAYEALLSDGGFMLFEDYGHPHCLGARLAVDEMRGREGVIGFFSHFSGTYVASKGS